jgi:hypothetical protein
MNRNNLYAQIVAAQLVLFTNCIRETAYKTMLKTNCIGWYLKIIKCPKEIFGDLREEEDTVSGKGSAHTSGYPHTGGGV